MRFGSIVLSCLAPTVIAASPLEIKGVAIGTPAADVAHKFGEPMCNPERCVGTSKSKSLPIDFTTIADHQVDAVLVSFENGTTVALHIRMDIGATQRLVDALIGKFGKPKSETNEPYKTRGGLSTTQRNLVWTQGDHQLKLTSPSSRIDELTITLNSLDHLRRFNSSQKKKASSDL